MKKLGFIILLLMGGMSVKAAYKQDTTIVEFTDKGVKKRITVYTSSKKDFDLPKNLNVENVLKSIGVDSSERKKAIILLGQNGSKQDTILVVASDGRNIKIVARDIRNQMSKSDTLRNDREEHWSRRERNDDDDDDDRGNDKPKTQSGNRRFFSKSDFGFYIGLNNWANGPSTLPTLQTWGSRFIALSLRRNATLINGKKVDMALSYGPEISWNNFMFEEDNYIDYSTKQITFNTATKSLNKSKLVVTSLNLPIMLNFGFEEAKLKIGIGGYIGYRVGSYRKLKYSDSNKKENDKGNYGLNDFRYGLTAEIGKRRGITFFGRYDLSELFKSSQKNVAGVQAWSIGLRL